MLPKALRAVRERFRPLRTLRRNRFVANFLLPLLDRPVSVRLKGVSWPVRVRLIQHATYIADSRIVEPGESALFSVLCEYYRPKVFWDVGANMGFYSWLLLSTDPEARAVLFEPDPDNLALMARTIKDAGLRSAEIVPCAVSDTVGTAWFRTDKLSGHTGALAEDAGEGNDGTIPARVVTLDAMLADRTAPDLVKIDVEGGEARALAGATRLIDRHHPLILIESFGPSREGVLNRLRAGGYVILGADSPEDEIESASNFLALPSGLAGDVDALRRLWRAELAARGLTHVSHGAGTGRSGSSAS